MGTEKIEETIVSQGTRTRERTVCDCCGVKSVDETGNEVDMEFHTHFRNIDVLGYERLKLDSDYTEGDIIAREYIQRKDKFNQYVDQLQVAVVGEVYHYCDICDSVLFRGDA